MPQYIMKLHDDKTDKDFYLMWSTIVDAPISYGMDLEAFKKWYLIEYPKEDSYSLEERLTRVEEKGISALSPYDDYKSYFEYNRAGENETLLTKEQIIEQYCTVIA